MAKMKNALKTLPESKNTGTAKKMGMKPGKPMVPKGKPTNDKVKGGMKPGKMKPFS
jgi:hypothetical protein